MKIKLYARDGGFVAEVVIPPFNDPPEALLWGSRLFVLPNANNYGHRHVCALPTEPEIVHYVEAWAYAVALPEARVKA